MRCVLVCFLICFSIVCFSAERLHDRSRILQLKIHVYGSRNGKGLENDMRVLQEAITQLNHSVHCIGFGEPCEQLEHVDINIFLEIIDPSKLSNATQNWFIPNPEWYTQEIELLDGIDLILCRTKEVERIFKEMNKKTYFLGFTSLDCYRNEIEKNYSLFFHLAGGSIHKGTNSILNIWRKESPYLTIIRHNQEPFCALPNLRLISHSIPQQNLRQLQNVCGIHLCPSETEGFGHYLMEAMSTGAVVITTDAPPMNEFIFDSRCLVPYTGSSSRYLGVLYYVDPEQLKARIKHVAALPIEELKAIGQKNRCIYLNKKQEFYDRLKELLERQV